MNHVLIDSRLVGLVAALVLAGCGGTGDSGAQPSDMAPDLNPCPSLNLSSGQPSERTCTGNPAVCNYFEAKLVCRGTWEYCWDGQPLQCPRALPQDGSDCGGICTSLPCNYACVGGMVPTCTCMLNRWSCSMAACRPDGGSPDGG